jgi:hypothetical protein
MSQFSPCLYGAYFQLDRCGRSQLLAVAYYSESSLDCDLLPPVLGELTDNAPAPRRRRERIYLCKHRFRSARVRVLVASFCSYYPSRSEITTAGVDMVHVGAIAMLHLSPTSSNMYGCIANLSRDDQVGGPQFTVEAVSGGGAGRGFIEKPPCRHAQQADPTLRAPWTFIHPAI